MGIFEPDFWKTPSELVTEWRTILGGLVAGAGILGAAAKWGRRCVARIRPARSRAQPSAQAIPPPVPLCFVLRDHDSFWARGSPYEQVHGYWDVTNPSDGNVVLVKARLRGIEENYSHVSTRHPHNISFGTRFPVMAHQLSAVAIDLMIPRDTCSPPNDLVVDVVFTDNFGHEHTLKSVRFRYRGPPR